MLCACGHAGKACDLLGYVGMPVLIELNACGLSSVTCKASTTPDVAAMLCKCLSNACIRHFHTVGGWVTHSLHSCLIGCAAELGVEQAPDLLLTQYTAFTDSLTPSTIDGSIECACQCNLLGLYEFSDLLALLCVCKVSSIHFTFTDVAGGAISAGVLEGSKQLPAQLDGCSQLLVHPRLATPRNHPGPAHHLLSSSLDMQDDVRGQLSDGLTSACCVSGHALTHSIYVKLDSSHMLIQCSLVGINGILASLFVQEHFHLPPVHLLGLCLWQGHSGDAAQHWQMVAASNVSCLGGQDSHANSLAVQ